MLVAMGPGPVCQACGMTWTWTSSARSTGSSKGSCRGWSRLRSLPPPQTNWEGLTWERLQWERLQWERLHWERLHWGEVTLGEVKLGEVKLGEVTLGEVASGEVASGEERHR